MNTDFKRIYITLTMFLCMVSPVTAQFIKSINYHFSGQIIRIIDADTLVVARTDNVHQTTEYRDYVINNFGARAKYFKDTVIVTLAEIDCPEKNQAYGDSAKIFISEACLNKEILFEEQDQFLSDILCGQVTVFPEIFNLNGILISAGLAWCDTVQYLIMDRLMLEAEQNARKQKLGLWRDERPIPPWKFRERLTNR